EFKHYSVMLNEAIEYLDIKPEGKYLDGTLGGAGHSSVIASKLKGAGKLYGVDQDSEAIEAATKKLEPFKDHVEVIKSNYRDAVKILKNLGVTGLDGILLDLGVSSYQLDNEERGFSYRFDTPLDMRMDKEASLTARDIVNTYRKDELARIIRDYGEDRFAQNIAKHIVEAREIKPIETTFELNDIIRAAIPMKIQATGGHPSKRTFQAIRIECNHELDVLKDSLKEMIEFLNPGGRIVIITFHSLEDRIVKDIFKEQENPCICPPNFPVCACGRKPLGRVITKKPVLPSEKELNENSRSKSAKLRVFERT
ncbi:MAG: 16S rRNA (cytosine(1402)-N(4))-methyltransferase RsmH, partial [Lachnospiraceae bacterium]|nr:16S rRNA (cytosine(1402)-N(4))-methyltransferase RsmH [Lachnospiraceae bacterium]